MVLTMINVRENILLIANDNVLDKLKVIIFGGEIAKRKTIISLKKIISIIL